MSSRIAAWVAYPGAERAFQASSFNCLEGPIALRLVVDGATRWCSLTERRRSRRPRRRQQVETFHREQPHHRAYPLPTPDGGGRLCGHAYGGGRGRCGRREVPPITDLRSALIVLADLSLAASSKRCSVMVHGLLCHGPIGARSLSAAEPG